jgi:hypothetical protein
VTAAASTRRWWSGVAAARENSTAMDIDKSPPYLTTCLHQAAQQHDHAHGSAAYNARTPAGPPSLWVRAIRPAGAARSGNREPDIVAPEALVPGSDLLGDPEAHSGRIPLCAPRVRWWRWSRTSTSHEVHRFRTQNVRNDVYGGAHDQRRLPVATASRRHRGRAPRRCPRPSAHNLPLEGRRPRRASAAAGWPSSTAMTTPSASGSVKTTGKRK